jgi:hypothetical protein
MKEYPTIADAKKIAWDYRRRGIIILSFGSSKYHAASYGITRKDCDGMKGVVEQIAGLIEAAVIELPPGIGLEFDPVAESGGD